MRPLVLALLALAVVVLPAAEAGPGIPPEKMPECSEVPGAAKCERMREEVRDLLTCTCPPL